MSKKDLWFMVSDLFGWLSDFLDARAVNCAMLAFRAGNAAFKSPPKGWRHGNPR